MPPDDLPAICRAATARIAAGDPQGGLLMVAEPLRRAPHDPNLLYVAGNCALAQGDSEAALDFYRRSVTAAPAFVAALANLGFVLRIRQHIAEAQEVLRRAVACEPGHVLSWINLVSCHVNEGDAAAGEHVARQALRLNPANAHLRWNLAILLLEQGRWSEGWQHYWHRFETPAVKPPPWTAGLRRLGHPEQLASGQIVLCHGEQGLGDEILFAGLLDEFIADARTRHTEVVLVPNPRLAGVFARSWGLRQLDMRGAIDWPHGRPPDWYLPIGDLAGIYRSSDHTFPDRREYLTVDGDAVNRLRAALAAASPGRPLVGIAWKGGSAYTHAVHRTIPLDEWLPVLRHDAIFVSLAYHDATAEIQTCRQRHGIELIALPEVTRARDYERTCELVAALDLVITVPTSVHHVAGAVGTRCWLVMDERAAWRECSRDGRLPWYPRTHRRFVRPRSASDWSRTLADVTAALSHEGLTSWQ